MQQTLAFNPPVQYAFFPCKLSPSIVAFDIYELPPLALTNSVANLSKYASCPRGLSAILSLIHALFPQESMPCFDRRVVPRCIVLDRRLGSSPSSLRLETFASSLLKLN
jgi:hypothetical protein